MAMGRTPAIVDDRRDQILGAALRVFAEKGFDRATNKDIARAAGITPGLTYHYFKSKEDVLREAIERHSPLTVIRSDEKFVSLLKVFLPEAMHHGNLGELRPANAALTSHLLLGGLMDLVLRRRVIHDPTVAGFTAEQIADNVVSTALHGLLPR